MKTFKVSVEWALCGIVKVEAETIEEAIEKIENDPDVPLPDGNYLDGSFMVHHECTKELNS